MTARGWQGLVVGRVLTPLSVSHQTLPPGPVSFHERAANVAHRSYLRSCRARSVIILRLRPSYISFSAVLRIRPMTAWYENARMAFIQEDLDGVVGQLTRAAVRDNLHIEADQEQEWEASIGLLQRHLDEHAEMIRLLKDTLTSRDLSDYQHVILEYDFRRRGLRLDCVLLGKGIIAIVEFKRTKLSAADRDQVTDYAINLMEFHEETRKLCGSNGCVIATILALTTGQTTIVPFNAEFHHAPWSSIVRRPLECDRTSLHAALVQALNLRRTQHPCEPMRWLQSRFAPSSTIIDAAISLYGQHDVSSINAHAAPVELIDQCKKEVAEAVQLAQRQSENRIVFVSGAPGAGKTLVGLKLAFDPKFQNDAVFVTGNAPLVDVLSESLKRAYQPRRNGLVLSGYAHEQSVQVIKMSTFKIVKAHAYLGERGRGLRSTDGRLLIFDEAQRTYQKGRMVLRKPLEDDEALLILQSLEALGPGAVVVALVGHNQAINAGELGIAAWFKAARSRNWRVSIGDATLAQWRDQPEDALLKSWVVDNRSELKYGHLPHSLRFYRNREIEQWADHVLADRPTEALSIAQTLQDSDTIWLCRDLPRAKAWVRNQRVGDETAGIIASGQARRLAAEGLFVDLKPKIAPWILAPSGDIRSSNMLETVQNQYQIQGLEIDYALVCWDGDLQRGKREWQSFKLKGTKWQNDHALDIAKNGYRVLLTRARKGMVVFVPTGDPTGEDPTRPSAMYDRIAAYLTRCGARSIP